MIETSQIICNHDCLDTDNYVGMLVSREVSIVIASPFDTLTPHHMAANVAARFGWFRTFEQHGLQTGSPDCPKLNPVREINDQFART
ncbi:hypothetical protein ACH79_38435 [Bradyrhizobium sp. CCBAU 051011]|nr:hypothetical protein ACH79_38435 [Bradyrhizobium sp. CCBAU 051011]